MSEEQLKAFLEKVKGDAGLQRKIKAALDAETVIAMAEEAGFSICSNDLSKVQLEIPGAELESMAGGGAKPPPSAQGCAASIDPCPYAD